MSDSRDLCLYLRVLCVVGVICARFDEEACLLQSTPGSERYALFYNLAIVAAIFGCLTYVYSNPRDFYSAVYSETGNFYEIINLRLCCAVLCLLHICFYMRRCRHLQLVQKMLQLHRACSSSGSVRQSLRNFIIYTVLLLLCLFNYLIGYLQSCTLSTAVVVFVFVYTYGFLVMALLLVFFVCLQHIVAEGLAHCNTQLAETKSMSKCRRLIFERYQLLGITVVELNICFGLLMIPIVPLVIYMAPAGPLFLISTVMEDKFLNLAQISMMWITCIIWNVPWVFMMALMLSTNVISVEANKTAKILAKIPRTGSGLDRMVEKFLLKNLRQQPILTAYGFFALDKSTLFKLFTAIFTYMVILVQFKEMENSTKSLQKAQ